MQEPVRTFCPDDEDAQNWFASYNLLTAKPTIYAANVAEDDLADDGAGNPHVAAVREMAKNENSEVFVICAQIEQEIAELDDDEKQMFLEDLGLKESGLDKLVAASYSLLGLISFLTSEEALRLAGLDWNVVQEPIYTPFREKIEGFKANVRDSDRKVLGVVSDRYKVIQNVEAFSFTDELLGQGVRYETAGSLSGGSCFPV